MSHFNWWIDGTIVGVYLVITMTAGIMVRRYLGKVEHFLVAGREVNVFLGIASLAATEFGVITCMYTAQAGYKYGFAGAIPGLLQCAAMFLVGMTGFCVKPLRDAGVMTIPELFEKRYGSRVRWAAGVVIVLGGLLNMGPFLRITGEFLLLVFGLEPGTSVAVPLGFATLHVGLLEGMMTVLLLLGTIYTVAGGLLSVLITDFLQFIVMSAGLIAVTILILWQLGFTHLTTMVDQNCGPGGFNPLINPELGWSFVLFNALLQTAATLTWQTTISRLLAAKDTKTGRQVYTRTAFFFVCRFLVPGVWGIAAISILGHASLAGMSPAAQDQATLWAMPRFLAGFVPAGLMGLLLAAMLAADMASTSSYMITWGSVIYNDIMAPFRRTKWSDRRGILWNRIIVVLIGLFLMFYGLWYPLSGDVWAYLGVTGTIYLASMSTLLIACCYWKRANAWGATAAIVVGAVIPILFLILQQLPATKEFANNQIGPYYSGIAAYFAAGLAMIIGSLLKPRRYAQQALSGTPALSGLGLPGDEA
jgi:SSS family solute:Na+ symporter